MQVTDLVRWHIAGTWNHLGSDHHNQVACSSIRCVRSIDLCVKIGNEHMLRVRNRCAFARHHTRERAFLQARARLLQKKSTICEARSTPLSASDARTAKERDARKA